MARRNKHRSRKTKQADRQTRTEMVNAERGGYEEEYVAMPITVEAAPVVPPKKCFVIDTNLILSCVDILYDPDDENWKEPLDFKPDLRHAHIIIPMMVYEELDHIKDDHSDRGMKARCAFGRLKKFFANSGRSMEEIALLKKPIETGWEDQVISLLPLPKDFHKCLPWLPDSGDNDGWIAVTALAATMIREGIDIRQRITPEEVMKRTNRGEDVILLTNDKGLPGKADLYAVRTEEYSFEKRPSYTGCRELVVPAEMLEKFFFEGMLTKKEFEAYMPGERALVANEFVEMTPENDDYPRGYFTTGIAFQNVGMYHKENQALYPLRYTKKAILSPPNWPIACLEEALWSTHINAVIVHGDAGTGKTFTTVVYAINAVKAGRYSRIIIIPSQSAKSELGTLPGDKSKKMEPLAAPIKSAIRAFVEMQPEAQKKREELRKPRNSDFENPEKKSKAKRRTRVQAQEHYSEGYDFEVDDYMVEGSDGYYTEKYKKPKSYYPGKAEKKKAQDDSDGGHLTYNQWLDKQVEYIWNQYFVCIPHEETMGYSFQNAVVIYDEAQRTQIDDADTMYTRPGKGTKVIILGDTKQIHDSSPGRRLRNGLTYAATLNYDSKEAAIIHLTENMRGGASKQATENRDAARDLNSHKLYQIVESFC